MKGKWFAVVSVLVVLSLLFGTAAFAGTDWRPGAPHRVSNQEVVPTDEPTVELTEEPGVEPTETPEPPVTTGDHPVLSTMARFFGVAYTDLEALHDSGLGMGIIARVYLISDALGVTPEEVVAMRDDKAEWQDVVKGLKDELKGGKLGSIMSGRRVRATLEPTPDSTPTAAQLKVRAKVRDTTSKGKTEISGKKKSGSSSGGGSKGGSKSGSKGGSKGGSSGGSKGGSGGGKGK